MAIVNITTTHGAVRPEDQSQLARELATLTYEAEGFAGSSMAPMLSWTFFDERTSGAFSTGAGDPAAALYYVQVTSMAGAIGKAGKQKLGESITSALLALERSARTPENLSRVWVRFVDVADGDLIVGGEAGSLAHLKAVMSEYA